MLSPLISRGFLPRELPPLFSSASMDAIVGATLPEGFTSAKAPWTLPVYHNLARPGGLRRRLTVPNPLSFYRLAKGFSDHSAQLVSEWAKSPFSRTTPNQNGLRALANHSNDRATPRAAIRVGARYVVQADISQFYPSVYTHSVPWALHTKQAAKAQMKDPNLPGNVLDRELQACQLGQTKGLPIGPDTSLGIAELLLSPLDLRINNECNVVGGVRFIDDIELTFRKLADADAALVRLEALLSEFELQLNATKTRIVELPEQVESYYVTSLRPYVPTSKAGPSRWIDFFNRALIAAKEKPADTVLRYATASLQGVLCSEGAWDIAQTLLWQCITIDPGCLRFVVDVLLINKACGRQIDLNVASVAINSLIQSSCPVGHGSEVLWSIWAALVLKIPVTLESQAAISGMDDCLVACAAVIAKQQKLFPQDFESGLWASWIVEDAFSQEHWLFAYEALRRGWYKTEVAAASIAKDPNAGFLVSKGVTFLDESSIEKYAPAKLATILTGSGIAGGGGGAY